MVSFSEFAARLLDCCAASFGYDASPTKADTIMTEADLYMIETDTLRHIGRSGNFAGRQCIIVFLQCDSR